jgi:hypothetical protein
VQPDYLYNKKNTKELQHFNHFFYNIQTKGEEKWKEGAGSLIVKGFIRGCIRLE